MENFEVERSFETKEMLDFIDITEEVRAAVISSNVRDGRVTVFSPSPSSTLIANERESGLLKDIRRAVDKLTNNGVQANGTAAEDFQVGASSLTIPVVGGELRLGTWQRLLLVELEAPADRKVIIQIVGE
jgi:secondary thiamine-phosphate synthase enzyme